MARHNNKNGGQGKPLSPLSVFFNIIGTLMILAVLIVGLITAVPKLMGHQVYDVLTGSMEPELPVGTLIIVDDVDPSLLKEGDIITFERTIQGDVVTHRVVSNNAEEMTITTKGDANEQEDMDPVMYSNVLGIVTHQVPHLGAILAITASSIGKLSLICLALAGLLFTIIAGKSK